MAISAPVDVACPLNCKYVELIDERVRFSGARVDVG